MHAVGLRPGVGLGLGVKQGVGLGLGVGVGLGVGLGLDFGVGLGVGLGGAIGRHGRQSLGTHGSARAAVKQRGRSERSGLVQWWPVCARS